MLRFLFYLIFLIPVLIHSLFFNYFFILFLTFLPITYTCSSSLHSCYMLCHLILLNFIILIILGEEYKSGSSSLRSFLYPLPPLITAPFGPNILTELQAKLLVGNQMFLG
jgi:hypothetical protein